MQHRETGYGDDPNRRNPGQGAGGRRDVQQHRADFRRRFGGPAEEPPKSPEEQRAQIHKDLDWMDSTYLVGLDPTVQAAERADKQQAAEQAAESAKIEQKRKLLNHQLDNLTNENTSKLRKSRIQDVRLPGAVLDDFTGRKIAGQPYEHERDNALKALETLKDLEEGPSAKTRLSLRGLRQELDNIGSPEEEG